MGVYAIIENDLVVNTVVSDSLSLLEDITKQTHPTCIVKEIKEGTIAGIGYTYDNGKFTPPLPPKEDYPLLKKEE